MGKKEEIMRAFEEFQIPDTFMHDRSHLYDSTLSTLPVPSDFHEYEKMIKGQTFMKTSGVTVFPAFASHVPATALI